MNDMVSDRLTPVSDVYAYFCDLILTLKTVDSTVVTRYLNSATSTLNTYTTVPYADGIACPTHLWGVDRYSKVSGTKKFLLASSAVNGVH